MKELVKVYLVVNTNENKGVVGINYFITEVAAKELGSAYVYDLGLFYGIIDTIKESETYQLAVETESRYRTMWSQTPSDIETDPDENKIEEDDL